MLATLSGRKKAYSICLSSKPRFHITFLFRARGGSGARGDVSIEHGAWSIELKTKKLPPWIFKTIEV
jgi:hypothetical protein